MSMGSFDTEKRRPAQGEPSSPECIEVRHEIMAAVFMERLIVTQAASIHIERCAPCREWEAEFKRMHHHCRTSAEGMFSPFASDILGSRDKASMRAEEPRAAAERTIGRALDRGALFIVVLAVALFQVVLAAALEGSARILYPVTTSIAMLVATFWVYFDTMKRGMPTAFWTALQPFTVPIGLIAYLVCRERESQRCPGCGSLVPSSHRFCSNCGRTLTEICCGCGRPVRKEFRICPYCGTRLEECFHHEGSAGKACAWSRAQLAFLIGVNAALLAVFLTALLRGDARASFISAIAYLFGFFPVFNWVSIDSRRRAMNSIAWGALVLVTFYVGLVVYLACRRDIRIECPVCGSYPPASFNFCPCCGSSLGVSCPVCSAAAAPGGHFCASCGEKLS